MKTMEAIHEVREIIGDIHGEVWTDERILTALNSIIEKTFKIVYLANPILGSFLKNVSKSSLEYTDEGYIWKMPRNILHIDRIYYGITAIPDIPSLDSKCPNVLDGWYYSRKTPNAIVIPGEFDFTVRYFPRKIKMFVGTSGNDATATTTQYWKVGTLTLGELSGGDENMYENHFVTLTHNNMDFTERVIANTRPQGQVSIFTVANAREIQANDIIQTETPFNGLFDNDISIMTAYQLTIKEGHRRGQEALYERYQEAFENIRMTAANLGDGGPDMVEEVC